MRKTLFRLCTGISIIGLTILLIACKPPVSDSAPQTPKTPEQMVPPAKPDPKADVAAAKEALSIVGTHSETLDRITKKIVLPTTLGKDVTVTWKSSDETVIKADGTVTRAAVNKKVTLTATLKKGDESATKAFTVTVYGTDQEAADTALARISAPKALVYGATSSVPLDKAVDSINVTWNAEPADIIHTSTGAVTKPSTKTRVTLTASITRGEATASKTYTVTVYPEGATPTAQELLDAATITLPAETTDDIPLQQELDGKLLTWTSSNTASIRIEANTAVVIQDLVLQTVTLTAKITESGASAEKTFSVTVPAITEITESWGGPNEYRRYEFANGMLTFTDNSPYQSKKTEYAITVNAEEKIITATLKSQFSNGEWLTPEQMKQQDMKNTTVGKYEEALGTLADTPVITLQSIRDSFAFAEEGNGLSDEDFFKDIRKDFFSETMTYTQFQQLSDTERTQQIKARIEQHRQEYLADYGLEATATWQEIAQKARNIWIEDINAYFEEIKHPKRYTYKVNKNTGSYLFETHRVYNPEKRWFEQDAEWQTQTPGTPWMYIYGLGNHNRDFTLHIKNSSNENRYEAQRNENGTSFTARKQGNPSEPEIHGTVTDNNESITVNFGGIDYTLQYRGRELSVY